MNTLENLTIYRERWGLQVFKFNLSWFKNIDRGYPLEPPLTIPLETPYFPTLKEGFQVCSLQGLVNVIIGLLLKIYACHN